MTAEEYLNQAKYLDEKINNKLDEQRVLCEMTENSSVKGAERIRDMEREINDEIDLLVDLKKQIKEVISSVPNPNESMALEYRYIRGYTFERTAEAMRVHLRTVYRWCRAGLEHIVLPDNPINIRKEN